MTGSSANRPAPAEIGAWVARACELDVIAPKPGNVHVGAAFADLTADDFRASAQAIRPVFEECAELSVGEIVLAAIRATRARVDTNTNLGIVLLLAPLARAAATVDRQTALRGPEGAREAVRRVVDATTRRDAELVYEAIRLARPGGLGQVEEGDVASGPGGTLLEMMALAAERDLVARQYAGAFGEVLEDGRASVERWSSPARPIEVIVIGCYLDFLSRHRDSLIRRKCGDAEAARVRGLAGEVLAAGWPDSAAGEELARRLDAALRAAGGRLNPGTCADLTVATLFGAQWAGIL